VTATLLQPGWLIVLFVWNFMVLAAAQLTIRLIMAFSVRQTLLGGVALTALSLLVAAVYDVVVAGLVGASASLADRLAWAPLPLVLMGLAGFAVARWVLKIKRLRGQIIAGLMVGALDPHLFTLVAS
jgi:hypothetical protein